MSSMASTTSRRLAGPCGDGLKVCVGTGLSLLACPVPPQRRKEPILPGPRTGRDVRLGSLPSHFHVRRRHTHDRLTGVDLAHDLRSES